jgi:pimeloyl-ACP methyl ester carboxylesterase
MTVASPKLAYDDRGTGVPLVFIHGLTFSRQTWAPILDLLANRFRCIAIDLPGHGESDGLPGSIREIPPRIHALSAELGIERPFVIGHSFGGVLASIYAANFPVRGVVNIDQPLEMRPFIELLHQIEPELRGPTFASAFEPIRLSIGVELLPEPLRSVALETQTIHQTLVLAYWDEPLTRSPDELQADVDATIARISTPYLAVFGHQLSNDERNALRSRLPQIELEEWPGCGHMAHLMDPTRFAERVSEFASATVA